MKGELLQHILKAGIKTFSVFFTEPSRGLNTNNFSLFLVKSIHLEVQREAALMHPLS